MNYIEEYSQTLNNLNQLKDNIIEQLVPSCLIAPILHTPIIDTFGIENKYLKTINFSDLKTTWSVDAYLRGVQKKYTKSLIKELKQSKNIIDKLNKIANYKNTTNHDGHYFHKLDDEIVNVIIELLGNSFYVIDKTNNRNISSYPRKQ